MKTRMLIHGLWSLAFACCLLSVPSTAGAQTVKEEFPSFTHNNEPDGTLYLPAPPDTLSQNYVNDMVQYVWGKTQRQGSRARQAIFDSYMATDSVVVGFSEAFGYSLSKTATPAIYDLVAKTISDAVYATKKVKKHYQRRRPFVQFGDKTLIPWDEASHVKSPSYPSSHSATGWAVALVLSELNPDRAEPILKRGYDFGQSRVIAGYHYQSDVDAARLAASAAVARIHTTAEFVEAMKKAQKELKRLQKK
jgi:acid phosphatase (class A)